MKEGPGAPLSRALVSPPDGVASDRTGTDDHSTEAYPEEPRNTRGSSPPGGSVDETGAVHLAVVARTGDATEGGEQQREEHDRHGGDHAAGGQGLVADRQPRQIRAFDDVVLRPRHDREHRGRDGDQQADDPYADALARAVEARHAPGDVATAVVGDGEHHEQGDRARERQRLRRSGRGLVRGRGLGEPDGRAGGGEDPGEQHGHADGDEPAEERRTPVEAAVLVALAGAHFAHRVARGRHRAVAAGRDAVVADAVAAGRDAVVADAVAGHPATGHAVVVDGAAALTCRHRPRARAWLVRRAPVVLEPFEHVRLPVLPVSTRTYGPRGPTAPNGRSTVWFRPLAWR